MMEMERAIRAHYQQVYDHIRPPYVRAPEAPSPDDAKANERAVETLKRYLSPEQLTNYKTDQSFIVTGNYTGTLYRILPKSSVNILELYNSKMPRRKWCFIPQDNLPLADRMLMQKLCLEADEQETMRIAHDQGRPDDVPSRHLTAEQAERFRHAVDAAPYIRGMEHDGLWIDETAPISNRQWHQMQEMAEHQRRAEAEYRMIAQANEEGERDRIRRQREQAWYDEQRMPPTIRVSGRWPRL
jgi:hypothetical protein